MEPTGKPRVIKDFDNLTDQLKKEILLSYPDGFSDHLISFTNRDGTNTHGILYEVEDKIYLIRLKLAKVNEDYDDDDEDNDSEDEEYDVLSSHSTDLSEAEDVADDDSDDLD